MKNSILNKFLLTVASFAITTIAFVPGANAESISITGNGEGSSSEVNISNNTETNIQQTNTAEINNNVDTTADTGNNTTDNNTGGNNDITTGDVSQTIDISNETNTSIVDQNCCVTPTPASTITISGNGTDSNNSTSLTSIYQTTVVINQNAKIMNSITETANTGNNSADNNTGKVSIHTGDIVSAKNINNNSINSSRVSISNNSNNDTQVKISNNGGGSINNITFDKNNTTIISINNSSNITNNITSDLNTGNNHADGNTGDVIIRTGDIISAIEIQNRTNLDDITIACTDPDQPDPDPITDPVEDQNIDPIQPPKDLPPTPRPIDPTFLTNKSTGPSDPPTQIGQVAAAVASILPATGNNLLFFALIGNIMMLLLGAYLRLRSGNSPGYAFAL
ncbi:hypothetical protein KKF69_07130 [Patescibacteria group bacterium]|nr:hypothetical protein [Patescibacteria group bacterium]